LRHRRNEQSGVLTNQIYLGKQRVAGHNTPGLGSGTPSVNYVLTDHLGTAEATADAARNITRMNYSPFGERIDGTASGVGYTGHVADPLTGFVYMQQRYYDPVVGRFFAPDPIDPSPIEGFNFNRYWYGNNNPYKYTDPDGRCGTRVQGGGAPNCKSYELKDAGGAPAPGSREARNQEFRKILSFFGGPVGATLDFGDAVAEGDKVGIAIGVAGATPLGKLGGSLAKATKIGDFFAGTKYTDKVLGQMKQGDFHAFPESVKGFQDAGQLSKITGGDGVVRDMLKIPGEYKGKVGFFEFIKEADGSINHRLFRPDPGQ